MHGPHHWRLPTRIHDEGVCEIMEMPGDSRSPRPAKTMAASSTSPARNDIKQSTHWSPIMIEVPPARIPEESVAVVLHGGICKWGVGLLVALL